MHCWRQKWCNVSHREHHAWCYVVSHLEYVLPRYNIDRTICKNGTRKREGDCNALTSQHPFDHCLLDLPFGDAFDERLQYDGNESETATRDTSIAAGSYNNPPPVSLRGGPCANCNTSGDTSRWRVNPRDRTTILCNSCYVKILRKRRLERKKEGPSGPCIYGCKTTWRGRWFLDPRDEKRTMCYACHRAILEKNWQTICLECDQVGAKEENGYRCDHCEPSKNVNDEGITVVAGVEGQPRRRQLDIESDKRVRTALV